MVQTALLSHFHIHISLFLLVFIVGMTCAELLADITLNGLFRESFCTFLNLLGMY